MTHKKKKILVEVVSENSSKCFFWQFEQLELLTDEGMAEAFWSLSEEVQKSHKGCLDRTFENAAKIPSSIPKSN